MSRMSETAADGNEPCGCETIQQAFDHFLRDHEHLHQAEFEVKYRAFQQYLYDGLLAAISDKRDDTNEAAMVCAAHVAKSTLNALMDPPGHQSESSRLDQKNSAILELSRVHSESDGLMAEFEVKMKRKWEEAKDWDLDAKMDVLEDLYEECKTINKRQTERAYEIVRESGAPSEFMNKPQGPIR